jgi:hypothetical protein
LTGSCSSQRQPAQTVWSEQQILWQADTIPFQVCHFPFLVSVTHFPAENDNLWLADTRALSLRSLFTHFSRVFTICGWQTPVPFLSVSSFRLRSNQQLQMAQQLQNSAKKHAGGRPKLVVAAAAAHSQPLFGMPGMASSAKGSLQSPTPTNTLRTIPGSAQAPGTKREYNTRCVHLHCREYCSMSPASQHCAACQHSHQHLNSISAPQHSQMHLSTVSSISTASQHSHQHLIIV